MHFEVMDAINKKLLNMLQVDSRLTAEQLAERLHLSPSAITRRVQRLWRDGSIGSEVIILSDKLRSQGINAIINVQLDRHHPMQANEMRSFFSDCSQVQVCLDITGTSDVLLIVSVRDMEHFNDFTDALAQMPLVRRYETHFVKRVVKFTTAVTLEEE